MATSFLTISQILPRVLKIIRDVRLEANVFLLLWKNELMYLFSEGAYSKFTSDILYDNRLNITCSLNFTLTKWRQKLPLSPGDDWMATVSFSSNNNTFACSTTCGRSSCQDIKESFRVKLEFSNFTPSVSEDKSTVLSTIYICYA